MLPALSAITPAPTAFIAQPSDEALYPAALMLAQIEYELQEEYEFNYRKWPASKDRPPEDTTGRAYLSPAGKRVIDWLSSMDMPLNVSQKELVYKVNPGKLQLLSEALEALLGHPPQDAKLFTAVDHSVAKAVYVANGKPGDKNNPLPDGMLVNSLGFLIEDSLIVTYEFENELRNAKWRMFHPDMDFAVDTSIVSFWNVVTLDDWNTMINSRKKRGFDDSNLCPYWRREKWLVATTKVTSDQAAKMGGCKQSVMVIDENAADFNQGSLNAQATTMSQWPRCRVSLLHTPSSNTLLSVLPVRLLHYPNDALLFHGTLRTSSASIDDLINFDAATRMAMGPGFYCTSNFNEAKAYALVRLKEFCNQEAAKKTQQETTAAAAPGAPGPSSAGQASAAGAPLAVDAHRVWTGKMMRGKAGASEPPTEFDVITVCVFLLRDAATVKRVTETPRNGGHRTDRTFIVNHRAKRGNQYVLHGGCRDLLKLVQVHDIDARGEVWNTNTMDTAHKTPSNLGPFRGVESAEI